MSSSNSIELSRRDKERQEQRLLSYVRRCAERKGAGGKVIEQKGGGKQCMQISQT